jgi:hypothetical protein
MRPWQHAKSSAHHFNGSWQNDLPIHEFLDMTKFAVADLRHRIILHNIDLGPRLAAAAFPNHPNAWSVARRHVEEDMRCTPSLADWLSHCDLSLLPAPRHSSFAREEVVDMLTRRQKLGFLPKVRPQLSISFFCQWRWLLILALELLQFCAIALDR